MSCDYNNQNYQDILSNRRNITIRILERLERRRGEVLYKKAKWFKWVRECQETEEQQRENEKKKVKKEAALFRRHMKEVQSRVRELRAREDLKRQEAYLEEIHKEALSQEEQEAEWDPIEDIIEDERGSYVDLLKHILFMTDSVNDGQESAPKDATSVGTAEAGSLTKDLVPKAPSKSKKSKQKALANSASQPDLPAKVSHDTGSQVHERLKIGVKIHYGKGIHVAGTIDNPIELKDKTAPFPDGEINDVLKDMAEIKHLLFCRLLLSYATVLPAAIQADSVEEFLNDSDVADKDLRDLALKMDNPGLQEIRDACADLGRGEEEEDDGYEDGKNAKDKESIAARKKAGFIGTGLKTRSGSAENWVPEREKWNKLATQELRKIFNKFGSKKNSGPDTGKTLIDFGDVDDKGKIKSRKMRVKICGRYIYNYPSESAISRGGWLQFCRIAKDSQLHEAIRLCRH